MDIQLIRKFNQTADRAKNTIGVLLVDGNHFGYTLEDTVRDNNHDGDLNDVGEKKIYGQTAIPCGRYKLVMTWSTRFKKLMPLIVDVPGFSGVRIHGGNFESNTLGCPLLGEMTDYKSVWKCAGVNARFQSKLTDALKLGEVYINIIDEI